MKDKGGGDDVTSVSASMRVARILFHRGETFNTWRDMVGVSPSLENFESFSRENVTILVHFHMLWSNI